MGLPRPGDYFIIRQRLSYWESPFPNSTEALRKRRDISDAVRAKIMGENAERFYRLAA
jgi:hypothetical protein